MTTERELHAQVEWLIKLAKITIERQDSMDSLLNSIHDRMLFSPPLAHASQFYEAIENDIDELGLQVDSVISGLNRIRAEKPDEPVEIKYSVTPVDPYADVETSNDEW